MIVLELQGPFKPYVRMTQKGKFVRPEARAYLDSKMYLQLQMKAQMAGREMLPGQSPLECQIGICHAGGFHNRDLDNEVKAILDAAQGIVYPDDRWIDSIVAHRWQGEAERLVLMVGEKLC